MSSENKPNISVTGGPGKPHNSDGTSSTSSTGGTGGMGFTGGSGASGLGGEVGKAIDSIMDMEESVGNYAKKVVYAGLFGATGGQGQLGSLDNAIKDSESLSVLSKKFWEQTEKVDDIDTLLGQFAECQTKFDLLTCKTNAAKAYFAYIQGTRLRKIQRIRGNETDWIKWISKKLPNIGKRTRERYMSLAGVPGVEHHLEYGVERLADFGAIYLSKVNDDEQLKKDLDPFSTYMKNYNVPKDSTYEERRNHIDAAYEVERLNGVKLEFPFDVMLKFMRAQKPLTGKERAYLKELGTEEAVTRLQMIIDRDLERKNLVPSNDKGKASASSSTEASNSSSEAGPNIDQLVVTLCKSLGPVASKGNVSNGSINRDALIELKVYIDQWLAMDQNTQSAQEAAA